MSVSFNALPLRSPATGEGSGVAARSFRAGNEGAVGKIHKLPPERPVDRNALGHRPDFGLVGWNRRLTHFDPVVSAVARPPARGPRRGTGFQRFGAGDDDITPLGERWPTDRMAHDAGSTCCRGCPRAGVSLPT